VSQPCTAGLCRQWADLWNGKPGTAALAAPEFTVHAALIDGSPSSALRGPAGLAIMIAQIRAVFPDLTFTTEVGPLRDGDFPHRTLAGRRPADRILARRRHPLPAPAARRGRLTDNTGIPALRSAARQRAAAAARQQTPGGDHSQTISAAERAAAPAERGRRPAPADPAARPATAPPSSPPSRTPMGNQSQRSAGPPALRRLPVQAASHSRWGTACSVVCGRERLDGPHVPFQYACGHAHGAVCLKSSRRLRVHSSASVSRLR
jgi:hypothetical protein